MSGRAAVIAVHGVADQAPFVTARTAADLLRCRSNGAALGFEEEALRIEVQPLQVKATAHVAATPHGHPGAARAAIPAPPSRQALMSQWNAGILLSGEEPSAVPRTPRRAVARSRPALNSGSLSESPSDADPNHLELAEILKCSREAGLEYYTAQLEGYEQQPEDAVYETVRLTSQIEGRPVDIYEMYWADLSRVRVGVLNAIEELYYVLFTVCSLGRMELDRSRRLFGSWAWWLLRNCHGAAERILTTVVPLGNLCLLLQFLFALPHLAPVLNHGNLPVLGAGFGLLAAVVLLVIRFRERPYQGRWLPALGLIVGSVAGYGLSLRPAEEMRFGVCAMLGICCCGLILTVGRVFNRRLPGMWYTSLVYAAGTFVCVLVQVPFAWQDSRSWALNVGLRTAEWVYLVLVIAWTTFLLMATLGTVLGLCVKFAETRGTPRRDVARRIAWTANLSILAPGMLSIVLNLGIWQAAHLAGRNWLEPLLPKDVIHTPLPILREPMLATKTFQEDAPRVITAHDVPGALIAMTAAPMSVIMLGVLVMLLSSGWLLLPAILAEGARSLDADYATQLGKSLSRAWVMMRRWSIVFVQALMVAVLALTVLLFFRPLPEGDTMRQLSAATLALTGSFFLFFATGASQFAGLRTIVDIAADVANWLRLHPRDNNPTSRITARYVSLLRYITERKDDDGNPYYDRVIIFAHSLGSAITVDLLQYLQARPDPQLIALNEGQIPIRLFTQGCPLRQLMGLRLPLTYGWARHGEQNWDANLEPRADELLGVTVWVNAYCSGDYVGRHVWYPDEHPQESPWALDPRDQISPINDVRRIEFCAGPGAHTHYWDPVPATSSIEAPSNRVAASLLELLRD